MRILLRVIFYLSITPILIPIISVTKTILQGVDWGESYVGWYFWIAIFSPQSLFPSLERFSGIYFFPVFIIYLFGFALFVITSFFILLEKRKSKKSSQ